MIQPERIMVALDVDELVEARKIAEDLRGSGVTFKIGNQLGTYEGWQKAIEFAHEYGAQIFCDTKFKDIPETVGKSARAITRHQPDFFNIMADTQAGALVAAVKNLQKAVSEFGLEKQPKLLGVTVLTSINEDEARSIYGADTSTKVLQFATVAAEAGLDGVVCSPEEAMMLRANNATKGLLLVTPGIRPSWAVSGDQSRIMTPKKAIESGVDYLVIGRPITKPPAEIGTPRKALEKIMEELNG
jgi:orotidine-5'-phosphate decarboxylase